MTNQDFLITGLLALALTIIANLVVFLGLPLIIKELISRFQEHT